MRACNKADSHICVIASQSLRLSRKSIKVVFPATCAVEKLLRAGATPAPRADQPKGDGARVFKRKAQRSGFPFESEATKTRMARGYRAIRLLGMEKKKKEKDGEAIKQRL